jgi:hypothetical protein
LVGSKDLYNSSSSLEIFPAKVSLIK